MYKSYLIHTHVNFDFVFIMIKIQSNPRCHFNTASDDENNPSRQFLELRIAMLAASKTYGEHNTMVFEKKLICCYLQCQIKFDPFCLHWGCSPLTVQAAGKRDQEHSSLLSELSRLQHQTPMGCVVNYAAMEIIPRKQLELEADKFASEYKVIQCF